MRKILCPVPRRSAPGWIICGFRLGRRCGGSVPIMEAQLKSNLPDIQSTEDARNICIDRVGVRGVELPVTIGDSGCLQHTVATVSMTVMLPPNQRGTHMSRFIALLEDHEGALDAQAVRSIVLEMLAQLHAEAGTVEIRFPYFLRKAAPMSRQESLMNYECAWIISASPEGIRTEQETITPVMSLCPCSKEISRYGAHNQRSHLMSRVLLGEPMSLREQIAISEAAGSSPLWARLKRADEKFVTEYAYDHPKFVEDIVRDMAKALSSDSRVAAYRVEAENFESIHNHSAYAWIERDKRAAG